MEAPMPSYVPTWRNDTYPAISPTRPELSSAGKTVVIAGGSQGIGRAIAQAFAEAGAAHVALLGRRINTLEEARLAITRSNPQTQISVHAADVTNEQALSEAAKNIGPWHVLVINAGVQQDPGFALDVSVEDWWRVFEINIKGTLLTAQTFFPSRSPNAAVIGISSSAFIYPSEFLKGISAYVVSKGAQARLLQMIAAECRDIFVGVMHPGVIETDLLKKSGVKDVPTDSIVLPANFAVWMASPEASFINGKFVYANWMSTI